MCGEIVCFIVASVDVAHVVLLPFEGHSTELAGNPGERFIMYLSLMPRHVCFAYRFVTVGALKF